MDRLHRNEFWRVETETWGLDEDENGYITGTETFIRGSSTPYNSREEATNAALRALNYGDWVKIVHYPSPFRDEDA